MYLQKGDKIGIVSPSRAIDKAALAPAIEFLESKGYEVVCGKHVYAVKHQFAGTDEQKIADIQSMIDDNQVKAILASRGGYGAVRVIDQLNFNPLKKYFKWFCGYSDFTVFHSHLNKQGFPTIHSTMGINMRGEEDGESISNERLINALEGLELSYPLHAHPLNRPGDAKAVITGGNLSVLYSILGSASSMDTEGKILFIEDLDEYLYHVDRMMINLKRNGKLRGLKALLVGGMTSMNDNKIPYGKTAEEIVIEHCSEYDYPIYFGVQAGHLQPNLAMRFGMIAQIKDNQLFLQP